MNSNQQMGQFGDINHIREILIRDLTFLNNFRERKLMNDALFSRLERTISNNTKFYENNKAIQAVASDAFAGTSGRSGSQEIASDLIKRYLSTPFGIFDNIMNIEASDIFIVYDKISFTSSNTQRANNIMIPNHLLDVYHNMLDLMIRISLYSSNPENTKFDRSNADLQYTTFGFRFNVTHESLNANNDCPIVAIRKQIVKTEAAIVGKDYINSIGVTKTQLDFIHKMAKDGSVFIFGETGSGKTTLLKYMGMYGIEDKRNLITIEDTPELFLPVNIAYLTNDKYTIHDMFEIAALRENPSSMIVGESRNEEIVDILQSATVFPCMTTFHASSLIKAVTRMVFVVKGEKPAYTTEDINMLITSTIDCFIYMKNRKVQNIWKRKEINQIKDFSSNAVANYEEVH